MPCFLDSARILAPSVLLLAACARAGTGTGAANGNNGGVGTGNATAPADTPDGSVMTTGGTGVTTGDPTGGTTQAGDSRDGGAASGCEVSCAAPMVGEFELQGDGSYRLEHVDGSSKGCSTLSPATCSADLGVGINGPDYIVQLSLPVAGTLHVEMQAGGLEQSLGSPWPAVAYLLNDCSDASAPLACGGTASGGAGNEISLEGGAQFAAQQVVYLVIDAGAADVKGAFDLTVTLTPSGA